MSEMAYDDFNRMLEKVFAYGRPRARIMWVTVQSYQQIQELTGRTMTETEAFEELKRIGTPLSEPSWWEISMEPVPPVSEPLPADPPGSFED